MESARRAGKHAVCIIGYGPVGATLANLLGLRGIPTLVLERETDAYHLPRAVHFDDEAMRLFQTIGLADTLLPLIHVSPGMRFVDAAGQLLMDWPRPQGRGAQGWHVSYRFHQPELERVLRDGVARWPSVTVRTCCEATEITQDADGASITVTDRRTGATETVRAEYVIGCDGARSLVRRTMGSGLEDLGFHERWLVVDVLLRRPRPDLGDWSVQFCDPARPATYVRGTGDRRRWEIALHEAEDAAAMEAPAEVWRLLAPWLRPEDAELERAACYTFHSAVATGWRNGRLLLAGDACHLTPPFLGQGMCAGLRDVANLAWKLERVLRGFDPDGLLDTYETERAPHVRAYIELAVRLGGLINTKAVDAALAVGARAPETEAPRMASLAPPLGLGLAAGWDGLPRRPAPQPALQDGSRLDDAVGYRGALLLRTGVPLPANAAARIDERDAALVQDPSVDDWLAAQGVQAALVAADRYVRGAARDAAELDALLAAL
ncbi:MAG: 3-(3-hydroxyphenyl)propionate hydroxylase [Rhodospirillales bacterium 69-11]|nr:bifunctional 3-(3-hydroxy-phenyl)propionate/3-hydroxycinnamic acid hydroxylase [Rhodospirillales bacterium]OJW24936.1 MAG: 3-(3-hydroxyphenyl)propionate hydroxylase [Rhodospirillales bacterium 69-11]